MPPLWLILGVIIMVGVGWLVDRLILKPRGGDVVLDGQPVSVRRKRDVQLLNAIMLGILIFLFVAGGALIEGKLVVTALSTIPLAGFVLWSLWRAFREADVPPTENEVRVGMRAGKLMTRHAWQAFKVIAVQIGLGALLSTTDGVLFWIVIAVNFVLFPVELWLLWRFLRSLRRMRAEAASS